MQGDEVIQGLYMSIICTESAFTADNSAIESPETLMAVTSLYLVDYMCNIYNFGLLNQLVHIYIVNGMPLYKTVIDSSMKVDLVL